MTDNPQIPISATIAADAHVAADVTTSAGCRVGSRTTIEPNVVLRPNVVIDQNAFVHESATIAAGAYVGESAVIADYVLIGPNAVVSDGVHVGTHAEIKAGSVATNDVPAYAIAQGNPAHIIGYRSSPAFEADLRLRASDIAAGSAPIALGSATLLEFPRIDDLRGGLVFGEIDAHLPFTPKRFFTVFEVPGREVRGEHAHRACHELLVCAHGECAVMVNDGVDRAEVLLDRPNIALHVPPMVWAAQYQYSPDAVLLVLCSHVYEADDYIRAYDEFERILANHG